MRGGEGKIQVVLNLSPELNTIKLKALVERIDSVIQKEDDHGTIT